LLFLIIFFAFSRIPVLKQKIAGKSLPIEKFALKKAHRYVKQDNRLTLPALVRNSMLLEFLALIYYVELWGSVIGGESGNGEGS
jgi:hypothetical protein